MNRSEDKFLFQRGTEYWLSKFLRRFNRNIEPVTKWEYVRHNKQYGSITLVEYNKESALTRLQDIKKEDIDSNFENWKIFYND